MSGNLCFLQEQINLNYSSIRRKQPLTNHDEICSETTITESRIQNGSIMNNGGRGSKNVPERLLLYQPFDNITATETVTDGTLQEQGISQVRLL